jgi:phenylacetate-CoA ligase
MEAQAKNPPFGGFADINALEGTRVFMSPGPIWEPQCLGIDPWGCARALYSAGFRKGEMTINALSYHMTPGGFILDEGLRALGCTVFPAGIGNTQALVEAAHHISPSAFTGTPDFLKIILDKANELGKPISSIKRAMVSGGALFPSLREEYNSLGINVMQCYATADLGVIAYESQHDGKVLDCMIVNEDLIVEIVRPGTNEPVAHGEVGELVVTNFNPAYPLVRFGTGDLSAVLDEPSPCGRTNMRIKGWMGRADQRTKVKGMFVDPKQIQEILNIHSDIEKARLVVSRENEQDKMCLRITGDAALLEPQFEVIQSTLNSVTNLKGEIELATELPNDGMVIADERDYDS